MKTEFLASSETNLFLESLKLLAFQWATESS